MVWPVLSAFVVQFPYHTSQCLMHSLYSAVRLRVVGCRSHLFDVKVIAHFLQDVIAEFRSLIRHKASREPIVVEVVVIQTLSDGNGVLIGHLVRLYVSGKVVYQ